MCFHGTGSWLLFLETCLISSCYQNLKKLQTVTHLLTVASNPEGRTGWVFMEFSNIPFSGIFLSWYFSCMCRTIQFLLVRIIQPSASKYKAIRSAINSTKNNGTVDDTQHKHTQKRTAEICEKGSKCRIMAAETISVHN